MQTCRQFMAFLVIVTTGAYFSGPALAAPSLTTIGLPFRIGLLGDQGISAPNLAPKPGGGFIAGYRVSGGLLNLNVRSFAANGDPLGDPVNVYDPGGSQDMFSSSGVVPVIHTDGTGLAIFSAYKAEGAPPQVFVRRLTKQGQLASAPKQVTPDGLRKNYEVIGAALTGGNAQLAWRAEGSSTLDIDGLGRVLNPAGGAFDAEQQIVPTSTGVHRVWTIAPLSSGGSVIAFSRFTGTGREDRRIQTLDAAGTRVGPGFLVGRFINQNTYGGFQIVGLRNGRFAVLGFTKIDTNAGRLFVRYFSATGVAGQEITVGVALINQNQNWPRLCAVALPDDRIVAIHGGYHLIDGTQTNLQGWLIGPTGRTLIAAKVLALGGLERFMAQSIIVQKNGTLVAGYSTGGFGPFPSIAYGLRLRIRKPKPKAPQTVIEGRPLR